LPDTDRVPDASRITPHVAPAGTRAGHDISINVALDAGVSIEEIKSASHQIEIERPAQSSTLVRLKDGATIPNKDFILRYDVAGKRIEDALITHRTADKGGFFTLILQPPDKIAEADITPREIVFVLDTSGSMSGFPVEKAKEMMKLALDNLNPQDTFNLITFAGDTHILFPEPVAPTPENMQKAQAFLASRAGGGGTEMMKAIRAALDPTDSQAHLRVVCFMTDGYVGNDMEIISEVQKHPNARVFSFGVGNSVNRFLLDKMAEYGRGEVEYVSLQDDGSAAARKFYERVHNPLLTDISIDWSGLPVTDVYPQRIPDLFGAKPVILSGRYNAAARGKIQLRGKTRGRDFTREIAVEFPEAEPRHDVLSTLWARARIDDLMGQDFNGMQQGNMRADLSETITQLGLEFRLLTQFTSFVAVEEMIVTDPTSGQPRRIEVPVELPEGINRAGALGDNEALAVNGRAFSQFQQFANLSPGIVNSSVVRVDKMSKARGTLKREERGRNIKPSGASGGGGGVVGGRGTAAPTPAPPPAPMAAEAVSMNADEMIRVDNKPLSPEKQKQQQLRAKLHPSLVAVVERVQKKIAQPNTDESKFVRDGKAEVQVWLTDKSPEVIAQLKQLGFEVILDPQSAKLIIGRITIDKLSALAELKAVRYVAPQT
ncbi:MAG: VWA domain-containing protein, partial [Pyrinomonadaceae bacterium]